MKIGGIYIGTSGWSYKSWAENFYPPELPVSQQLTFYATKFPTVEINRTFYRLPSQKAFQNWNREAPPGFLYSIKGSRAVTHFKRLLPGAKSFGLLVSKDFATLYDRCQKLQRTLHNVSYLLRFFTRASATDHH